MTRLNAILVLRGITAWVRGVKALYDAVMRSTGAFSLQGHIQSARKLLDRPPSDLNRVSFRCI